MKYAAELDELLEDYTMTVGHGGNVLPIQREEAIPVGILYDVVQVRRILRGHYLALRQAVSRMKDGEL